VLAQHCPNLAKLQLHSTSRAFTKQSILHIAAHLPLLKVLELLGCTGLDDSCIFALVRGCPELAHLSLDGLGSVSEAAICASPGLLQRLDSVALDGAGKFTISGLQSLLNGSKTLQHVFLPVGASVLESENQAGGAGAARWMGRWQNHSEAILRHSACAACPPCALAMYMTASAQSR
jgi:hypothetical protein